MSSSAPTLLAIDTATEICSVALLHAGQVIELREDVGQRHSDRVLPMVQQILAQAGVVLSQCDAIAFGGGPGSFTGLRIACGVTQGLAYGIDRPVLPVGNLRALALHVQELAPPARRIGAAIDARMNEVYWAAYEVDGARLRELAAPALIGAADCAEQMAALDVDAIGGNALQMPVVRPPEHVLQLPQACASAARIVQLAAVDWAGGLALPAAAAAPLYVRNRVALTVEERRAVVQG